MKENNKFSLLAFFCSLGSKSKLSKFVLLGAPFFLVYFFTLKVCATAITVPSTDGLVTNPTGGINSPIHNVLKMDTGSINSSLWVALGLDPLDLADIISDANEAYQNGNDVVYDAIIDSLNQQDSGSGDLLDYVIRSTYQASSQSGYQGKISIPDDVWDRVNKATKNGLNIRISQPSVSMTAYDFWNQYCDHSAFPSVDSILDRFESPFVIYEGYYANSYYVRLCLMGCTSDVYNSDWLKSYDSNATQHYFFTSSPTFGDLSNAKFNGSDLTGTYQDYNNSRYFWGRATDLSNFSVYGASSNVNKRIGVASDFIINKANENYDIVSKSSTYDPDTGKIVGARSINLITPAYLEELVASIRESIISIPEALQRLGIGAIDTDQAIPIGIGFDINTLSEVVAQSVPQEATAAATREAFLQLDNFQFYTPDDFVGIPSVAPIPVAMNWIAVQMQTIMKLTSFQNCWVILSSLAVLGLIVGLVRLSK